MVFHKLALTGLEYYSTSCYNNKNCYGHFVSKKNKTIKLSITKMSDVR